MYFKNVNKQLIIFPKSKQTADFSKLDMSLTLESWGHPIEKVKFQWDRDNVYINPDILLNQHNFQVALLSKSGHNFSTGMQY